MLCIVGDRNRDYCSCVYCSTSCVDKDCKGDCEDCQRRRTLNIAHCQSYANPLMYFYPPDERDRTLCQLLQVISPAAH